MVRLASHKRTAQWLLALFALCSVVSTGCTSWPFREKERTSFITPGMRIAAVREMRAQAEGLDDEEQQRLTEQLASQIRTEPDPLVRKAIQEAVAEYSTPLAQDVLVAGLNDADLQVRITCCKKLGEKGDPTAVPILRNVLESSDELDVRLAAVDSLGKISSTETVSALAIALRDQDPAMQYAGVQALKAVSGQDFGNDVKLWQQYAEGQQPVIQPNVSLAERIKGYSPF